MHRPVTESLRHARLFSKTITLAVLATFLSLTLQPLALAAQLPSRPGTAKATATATDPSAQLAQALEATEAKLGELIDDFTAGRDANPRLQDVKQLHQQLKALDQAALQSFAEVETHLKAKALPPVILDRHSDAVKSYTQDFQTLTNALTALEATPDNPGKKQHAEVAFNHLKAKLKKQPLTPFDPNGLPSRPAKNQILKVRQRADEFIEFTKTNAATMAGLQSGMSIAEGANSVSTAADLAETVEVQFSPEVVALAESLNRNAVRIYEYVKNNIVFEPYYGSLKGSRETLLSRAGNDFDQASLLIALLRNSNIPARYVSGTVEIPIQKAMNWLGVQNEKLAADMLATAGIPVTAIVAGGKIASVQIEHVWVEAYVPFENYRGHERGGIKQWIPLDPAFKQLRHSPGPDLKQMMQFDDQTFLNGLMANTTIDRTLPSVTALSESYLLQQIGVYQTNLSVAIAATMPGATPQDLVGNYDILVENLALLPASLPYRVLVTATQYATVPDSLRYRLDLTVSSINAIGGPELSYQATLTELAGKKVTLAYQPATASDEAVLASYGKLSATPAYLVQMKPVLRIDGIEQAVGSGVGIGEAQVLTLTFTQPGTLGVDRAVSLLTVGGYYAIGLNLQKVPKDSLSRQMDKLNATKSALELLMQGQTATVTADNVIGDMLHATALGYFYNLGASDDLIARLSEIVLVRQPSTLVTAVGIKSSFIFGIPISARPVGLYIDVQRNVVTPFSRIGDATRERAFQLQSGAFVSALEHIIFAQLFSMNAVSMAKVMQLASSNAVPIYAVSSTNVSNIMPLLQIDNSVKQEIQVAVQAGLVVMVPRQNIPYDGWQGTGYLIFDPQTYGGAFRISGGINGGSTTNNFIALQSSCAVPGDWVDLLVYVDRLLVLADAAFLGQNDLQPIANLYCELLQGMDPSLPKELSDKAQLILEIFSRDAAILVATLALVPLPLDLTEEGLITWVIIALTELISTQHLHTSVDTLRFGGAFIIHYLYEYLVLFRAGLFSAFPDQF